MAPLATEGNAVTPRTAKPGRGDSKNNPFVASSWKRTDARLVRGVNKGSLEVVILEYSNNNHSGGVKVTFILFSLFQVPAWNKQPIKTTPKCAEGTFPPQATSLHLRFDLRLFLGIPQTPVTIGGERKHQKTQIATNPLVNKNSLS